MRFNELVNGSKFTHLLKGKQHLNLLNQDLGPSRQTGGPVPSFWLLSGSSLRTSEVNYTLGLQQLIR